MSREAVDLAGAQAVVLTMPSFKSVAGDMARNFPDGMQWPVQSYVRQTRLENQQFLRDGGTVVTDTPYGRLYVCYFSHELSERE